MATTAAQDKLRKPLAMETTDPYGNTVICAQSTWDSHIIAEDGHPEMTGRLDAVRSTIFDPDGIRESTARPDARIFEAVTDESIQIRVVVTYDEILLMEAGTTIAKVNTAFPVHPEEYDRPQVGSYVYQRAASKKGEEGKK